MAKFWSYDVATFNEPHLFAEQSPAGHKRREILRDMVGRGEVMSYYEYRALPEDEMIAIAFEQEHLARKNDKTRRLRLGQSADGKSLDSIASDTVYMISGNLEDSILKRDIITLSGRQYLVKLENSVGLDLIYPTRLVFASKDIALFMRQELISYSMTPEVRV